MSTPPTYRDLAERNLNRVKVEFDAVPTDRGVRPEEVIARSARAQVIATTAVAQALLHIADVLAQKQGDATP